MGGKDGELLGAAVEGGAVLGAVEPEFDGRSPARADRKCGAADDHPDQHAGDEARLQMSKVMARRDAYSSRENRRAESISHS
jgi:hypothetical protein